MRRSASRNRWCSTRRRKQSAQRDTRIAEISSRLSSTFKDLARMLVARGDRVTEFDDLIEDGEGRVKV